MTWDPKSALKDFKVVAKLAGVQLLNSDVSVELHPAPHVPPARLPAGTMAVYVFSRQGAVLKVGKAGPKSAARYTSQHYNPGSASSTLARSLLADQHYLGLAKLDEEHINEWIRSNVDRVNFLVKSSLGIDLLSLLEAFLHCRLKPRY